MRVFKDTEDHLWLEVPPSHPTDTDEVLVSIGAVELMTVIHKLGIEPQHISTIQSQFGPLTLLTDAEP